jgi:hypothetical protein
MPEIPDFARAQAETGPIQAANAFLDAIQGGDVDAACQLAVPEFHARLRSGFAAELREKWSDVDDSWGWTTNPKAVGVDLELVMLVNYPETGYVTVTERTELVGIPFVMQYADGAWRVYALELPQT